MNERTYSLRRGMANAPLALHSDYDGSLHPDTFMEYLLLPGTELGPTDKNYKVYVRVFASAIGEAPTSKRISGASKSGDNPYPGKWVKFDDLDTSDIDLDGWSDLSGNWVDVSERGEMRETKFYFGHLNGEQRAEFVRLLNLGDERPFSIGYPGHFYVRPFFVGAVGGGV